MTKTLSVVQLPNTQGIDRYSLRHPVTALHCTFDAENLKAEINQYLASPSQYGLSNHQLYHAQYIALLIDRETKGKVVSTMDISESEADMALAGHLVAQARIARHVFGRFTPWLLADTAVDWEKEAIAWFEAVMDQALVVPEGYEDALEVIRNHMSITMSSDYVKDKYPEWADMALCHLNTLDEKNDQKPYINLTESEGFRVFPLAEWKVSELEKLHEWAEVLLSRVAGPDVQPFTERFPVKIITPGGAWFFLTANSTAHGDWYILESYSSVGGQSFRALDPSELKDFASHLVQLLIHKGSVEKTKIHAIAPRVGVMNLFMELND